MLNTRNLTLLVLTAACLSVTGLTFGQSDKQPDAKKPDIVREIQVTPSPQQGEPVEEPPEQYYLKEVAAAEPVPALKYRLYPSRGELKPGNSVPFYYRALVQLNNGTSDWKSQFHKVLDEIYDKPFNEYLDPEFQKRLRNTHYPYRSVVSELEIAAFREETDWDWQMTQLTGMQPISFLLPEAQEMREIARLLFVQARVEAAQGNIDEALHISLLNLKMAADIAKPPTLINDLIGIAIAHMSLATLRDIICQTDCPNLYWALATLPDPFISINEALEYEACLPEIMFPVLKDPETADRSSAEWMRLMREISVTSRELESDHVPQSLQNSVVFPGLIVRAYPIAKRELILMGWDAAKIDSMPVGQVVAIYQKFVTQSLYDNSAKWGYLRQTDQVKEAIDRAKKDLGSDRMTIREPIPIAVLLMPAMMAAKQAETRTQSKIQGLMVLEAIRMHAAANDGILPAALDEIMIVPVPEECPLTGEPYEYKYAEGQASLLIPTQPLSYGRRYAWEIHLSSK